MAKKTKKNQENPVLPKASGIIRGAGEVVEQNITDTLELNYMPYAMSVIMSRAIPEIDGFKPSHRKLLYTMYKMGLLGSQRTKSANIVGQTMKLNPHGDSAIYDTMVRLSRGYEALLHPYIDSKGNFGKFYSRDMAWAASRYTEARLDDICNELFADIDKDTVDFVDNYDNTMKEPVLLPASFPSVLVNSNTGIAVGMASSICPFNLKEICETTIALIRDENHPIRATMPAPDFPGGGSIILDPTAIDQVYETGRGGIRVRSKYTYDKSSNCIDITEIPPSTSVEIIVERVVELVKQGKIKEIADIRDETGLQGLKITIDLKRGTDPEKLMTKLFRLTTLEDTFSCNFNILIAGVPRVLGVREILDEWIGFRIECVRRRTYYDLQKKKERLHLYLGLQTILLDIDKAIKIIRETHEESEVIPNLMIGFGIDQAQAEYVAEIRLRHLNREYILKRTEETGKLKEEIEDLEGLLKSRSRIKTVIIHELENVISKYSQPRRTEIIYADEIEAEPVEEELPDYAVNYFFTKEGYFKKITPLSLRMGGEQKLKEDDTVVQAIESTNNCDLLFFSDKSQVYKAKGSDFTDTKASVLGDYIPAKLSFDQGESASYMVVTQKYEGFMLFVFENGKAAKVDLSAYQTKNNRKKLIAAYSDKSPIAAMIYLSKDQDVVIRSSAGRVLIVNSALIAPKVTRNTQGVAVMSLKRGQTVHSVEFLKEGAFKNPNRYRKNIPATGALLSAEDAENQQIKLL